ncbi:MAG: hypothetical protein ACRD2L_06395 [Terriglobia bacterium]
MKCPHCNIGIKGDPDTKSYTTDCPGCGALLLCERNVKAEDFHEAMNRENPRWPKDGKGTGFIEAK